MRRVLRVSVFSLALIVVLSFVTTSSPAKAASFDCTKVKGAIETAICGDPRLSNYDDDLAIAFKLALVSLSKDGREKFSAGQRDWVKAVRYVCGHGGKFAHERKAKSTDVEDCLDEGYFPRLTTLQRPLVTDEGDIVLTRAERFTGIDWPDQGYVMQEDVSFIQIEQPATLAQRNFNTLVLKSTDMMSDFIGGEGGKPIELGSQLTVTSEAGLVTSGFIAVRGEYGYFNDGSFRSYGESDCFNYLLTKDRLLTAADLFDLQKPWQDFLFERAKQKTVVLKNYEGQSDDELERDLSKIRTNVADISKWFIKRDGLHLFIGYDFFSRIGDPSGEVIVSWEDLRPYLAAGSPVEFLLARKK